MITLLTLKNECAQFFVNQTIASRIPDWVEWVLSDILGEYDYWWNKKEFSFSTTSGTAKYYLNHRVNMKQISGMYDTTNNGTIAEVSLESIYNGDPTPTETGTPTRWAFVGQAEVQAVTSAAATVSVVSGSTSDSGMTLLVRGKVSGVERYEEITLNGTTSATGTLSWDSGEIESVVLSAQCVGVVTVTAGSTTIAAIPPGYLRVQCPVIRLWNVPGGTYSITYLGYQRPVKPVKNSDIIDIPNEAFKALRYGIEEIAHMNNGDIDFSQAAAGKFKAAKMELYNWSTRSLGMNERKDYVPSASFGYRFPRTISATVTS